MSEKIFPKTPKGMLRGRPSLRHIPGKSRICLSAVRTVTPQRSIPFWMRCMSANTACGTTNPARRETISTMNCVCGSKMWRRFFYCRSLTQISLPATVSAISNAPFRGCESLKSIRVSSRNKNYKSEPNKREGNDHVLFNKNKSVVIAYPAGSREVQYDIPDSVTVISDRAFCECKKLNRITIPDSVHEIGEGAFCNCALLDEVEIPDSVTAIDDCAFRGCISLEKVIIPSSVVELGWGLFDGCESSITVYCDEGSAIQAYCRRNGIREARISEKENDG